LQRYNEVVEEEAGIAQTLDRERCPMTWLKEEEEEAVEEEAGIAKKEAAKEEVGIVKSQHAASEKDSRSGRRSMNIFILADASIVYSSCWKYSL
jgi:L-lactate utilization protein LutC